MCMTISLGQISGNHMLLLRPCCINQTLYFVFYRAWLQVSPLSPLPSPLIPHPSPLSPHLYPFLFPSPVLLSFPSTRGLLRNPSPSSHKFRTKWTQSLLILCNGPKITLCGFQSNVILVNLFISLDRYILSKYFIEKCTFVIIELSVSAEAKSLK